MSVKKGYVSIPLSKIVHAKWNYKLNDDKLQSKLVENIRNNGQIENLLVRELPYGTYEAVNGNHRLMALNTLNYKEAFVYNLGKISEEQAKRIAIETNETRFESDPNLLANLVQEISLNFEDFSETSPFSPEQMESFSDILDTDLPLEEEEQEPPKKSGKTKTVVTSGGEDFKIVKLEVSVDNAERIEMQIIRIRTLLQTDSANIPIEAICEILEGTSDESIRSLAKGLGLKVVRNKSKKKK